MVRDPRSTLLLIDLQLGLASMNHPYFGGARNNPDAERNAARLLAAWRAAKRPIIHVQHDSINDVSPLHPSAPGNAVNPLVAPVGDEPVFRKTVNSALIGTGLQHWLREHRIADLVICGITTNHCVSTSVRMAGNLGFTVELVGDACAAYDQLGPDGTRWPAETVHQVSLASLHREFATVRSTDDALSEDR